MGAAPAMKSSQQVSRKRNRNNQLPFYTEYSRNIYALANERKVGVPKLARLFSAIT
jgi:hypothetical protein